MDDFQRYLKILLGGLLIVAGLLAAATLAGCAATMKKGAKESSSQSTDLEQEEKSDRTTRDYGFKKYASNEWETVYEPIDPELPSSRYTDPQDGTTRTTNLRETRRNKKEEGSAESSRDIEESLTSNTSIEAQAGEESSWYEKISARVPWYAILIAAAFIYLYLQTRGIRKGNRILADRLEQIIKQRNEDT